MEWALIHGYVVFTHDLDFGAMLAATQAEGPSVLQIRSQDVSPAFLGHAVISAVKAFDQALLSGALVVVDINRSRVRILPIGGS